MKRMLLCIALLTIGALVVPPKAMAAPDTPPTLTWSVSASGTAFSQASSCGGGFLATQVAQSPNSDLYVGGKCYVGGIAKGFGRVRIASTGALGFSDLTTCVPDECSDGTMIVGPGGFPIGMYSNHAIPSGCTRKVDNLMIWTNQGMTSAGTLGCSYVTVTTSGSNDDGYGATWTIHDQDTVQYYWGSSQTRISFRCPYPTPANLTGCVSAWQTAGNPGFERVSHGLPATNLTYGWDNNGGSGSATLSIINRATGALNLTTNVPDSAMGPLWVNSTGDEGFLAGSLTNQVQITKVNSTTLNVLSGGVAPTEPTIAGFVTLQVYAHYLDGANDLFVCGHVSDGSGLNGRSFVAKYRMTGSVWAQRWNFTIDESADPNVPERATSCIIGNTGDLYVLNAVQVGTAWGTSLRKYAGAGTARPEVDTSGLVAVGSTSTPASTGAADFGSGMVNFATGIGFASPGGKFFFGIVLLVIVCVIAAAATYGASKSQIAAGIVAGIVGLGMCFFNVTQELWPLDATVIMIILASAVILGVLRLVFQGRGSGG